MPRLAGTLGDIVDMIHAHEQVPIYLMIIAEKREDGGIIVVPRKAKVGTERMGDTVNVTSFWLIAVPITRDGGIA